MWVYLGAWVSGVCVFMCGCVCVGACVCACVGACVDASTGGRCTGSTDDPQQFSPELLANGQESLSTVVQAEPAKLVTAKLMLLLLAIVRLPSRVTRWAIKGPNIQLNIKNT